MALYLLVKAKTNFNLEYFLQDSEVNCLLEKQPHNFVIHGLSIFICCFCIKLNIQNGCNKGELSSQCNKLSNLFDDLKTVYKVKVREQAYISLYNSTWRFCRIMYWW